MKVKVEFTLEMSYYNDDVGNVLEEYIKGIEKVLPCKLEGDNDISKY